MADEVPLVPAKDVPRRFRGGYVAAVVILTVLNLGAVAWVGVRTAAPKIDQADAEALKAKAEASSTVTKDEFTRPLLQAQLKELEAKATAAEHSKKEAEARAAAAEKSAKELDQLAKDLKRDYDRAVKGTEAIRDESSRVNKGLLAQNEEIKDYAKKLKAIVDEWPTARKPPTPQPLPKPPAEGALRAGGTAVVRNVIGRGKMTKEDGGWENTDRGFNVGDTVKVVSVTGTGVEIAELGQPRGDWLKPEEAKSYLQPIQEK